MKTHKIIVVLLILLGVSVYADDRGWVRGFTEENCNGNWLATESFNDLYDYHEEWEFESYHYLSDPDNCYPFEEPVKATGTVPTTTGGSSGGASSGGGGNRNNGNSNGPSTAGGSPDPAAVFDDEMNENLKECWQGDMADNDKVKNWEGKHAKTKWKNDPDFVWKINRRDHNMLGIVQYGEDKTTGEIELRAYLFTTDIKQHADLNKMPFLHIVLYTQMHEYAHILQWTHYQTQNPNTPNAEPPPYDHYDMELEAHELANIMFEAYLGIGSPFVLLQADLDRKNDWEEYDENKKKYIAAEKRKQELEEKVANGEELNKEETKDLEKAIDDLENLTGWFKNPENLPDPTKAVSASYDPEKEIDCELVDEEDESE